MQVVVKIVDREIVEKAARGRDERTPIYLQIGILGIVLVVVAVAMAIAVPLYYVYGG